ncbi:MAG: sigma-70 family RNA polymerase sigma factor [bacterium]|nr:sigma-70 family RNA polymerase sigma factor [bacterium]
MESDMTEQSQENYPPRKPERHRPAKPNSLPEQPAGQAGDEKPKPSLFSDASNSPEVEDTAPAFVVGKNLLHLLQRDDDSTVWGFFFDIYNQMLLHEVVRVLDQYNIAEHEAENVLNKVWDTIQHKIITFEWKGEAALKAWLCKIAVNCARRHCDRARFRFETSLDSGDEEATKSYFADERPDYNPEAMMELKRREAALVMALENLSRRDREIVVRYCAYDEKQSVLAAVYGITPSRVSYIIKGALERMRKWFEDNDAI